jgi:predicted transcriptional regulator
MKRRLHIGIRSREGSYEAALHALQRVETGDTKQSFPRLFFESIEDLRKILTTKRLDLLVAILRHQPGSVTELAQTVQRDLKNVSEDLTLLHQLGLVEFTAAGEHGNARTPIVPYDAIDLTIDLQALAERSAAA